MLTVRSFSVLSPTNVYHYADCKLVLCSLEQMILKDAMFFLVVCFFFLGALLHQF